MGVNLNNRCKICNLIKIDSNLFIEVHNKVLKEGLSHSAVCRWLNSRVDVLNADLSKPEVTKFNDANFTVHFQKHISSLEAMQHEVTKHMSSQPAEPTAFDETQQAIAAGTTDGQDSADRLSTFISTMEANLAFYNTTMEEKRNSKKSHMVLGMKDISNYSKLVGEYIAARQNLVKFRSLEQTALSAVESAVAAVVAGMAHIANDVADETKNLLEVELKEQTSIPEQVSTSIRSKFSGDMRIMVKQVIDRVKKDHGLR
jgi:hypothetical protein